MYLFFLLHNIIIITTVHIVIIIINNPMPPPVAIAMMPTAANVDDALTLASRDVKFWYIVDSISAVTPISVSVHAWLCQ